MFRWGINIVLIVAAVYFGWRYRQQIRAFLRGLWQSFIDLWASLFGRRRPAPVEAVAPPPPRRTPFAAFANPFGNGEADRRRPEELVRYSFAAMEAWGEEGGCGRPHEATPLEFAAALGGAAPELADEARELALLFSRVAYAGESPAAAAVRPVLSRLWRTMTARRVAAAVRSG